MNNSLAILHLSLIEGIGPVAVKTILASGITPADLYSCSSRDLTERSGISCGLAQKVVAGLSSYQELDREVQLLEQHGVHWATLGSAEYSELLAAIHAPPAVLYWRGEHLFHEQKTIAVVGSRQANRYAEQAIDALVPELVAQGWVVVSGGAIGADSMAHKATVRASGRTVAIVGSGLLKPYPASNKYLFDDIIARGGALVSCFPLETEAMPGLFPARNRIIAGMSRGCVVVQAAAKSGALITANLALEQGREVFAVPGPIGDELSAGCHELIQHGAKLICGVQDIVAEFEWFRPAFANVSADLSNEASAKSEVLTEAEATSDTASQPLAHSEPEEKQSRLERSIASNRSNAHLVPVPQAPESGPTGILLEACKKPISTDDLVSLLHEEVDVVQGLLFDLQLLGRIQQNFAGLWERR